MNPIEKTLAMINFTKKLPQNTSVIQLEHTEQYSKSSNQQRSLEAAFDSRGATCISDTVFVQEFMTLKSPGRALLLSNHTLGESGSSILITYFIFVADAADIVCGAKYFISVDKTDLPFMWSNVE